MEIEVRLHTILQKRTPQGKVDKLHIELPHKTALGELYSLLEIDIEPEELLFVVNGKSADVGEILHDGDIVDLIPAIAGG